MTKQVPKPILQEEKELLDKLLFVDKVNEGLKQSKQGKVFSKKEAEKKLSKWLK